MITHILQGFEPQINKFNEEDEVRKFKNENSSFGISGHNLNKFISAQTLAYYELLTVTVNHSFNLPTSEFLKCSGNPKDYWKFYNHLLS